MLCVRVHLKYITNDVNLNITPAFYCSPFVILVETRLSWIHWQLLKHLFLSGNWIISHICLDCWRAIFFPLFVAFCCSVFQKIIITLKDILYYNDFLPKKSPFQLSASIKVRFQFFICDILFDIYVCVGFWLYFVLTITNEEYHNNNKTTKYYSS